MQFSPEEVFGASATWLSVSLVTRSAVEVVFGYRVSHDLIISRGCLCAEDGVVDGVDAFFGSLEQFSVIVWCEVGDGLDEVMHDEHCQCFTVDDFV